MKNVLGMLFLCLTTFACGDDDASDAGTDAQSDDAMGVDAGPRVDGGVDSGPPPAEGSASLVFSDLTAGPASGWSTAEASRGAAVTIWGRGFGDTRGESYVSVGDVELSADDDYLETWGQRSNPVPFLQSITFRLNDTMPMGASTIRVHVDGVASAPLPFRVGPGNIFFVDANAAGDGSGTLEDPWSDPVSFIDVMAPGDVAYFREGIFSELYNGGKANIWVRESEAGGTEDAPIAFVGYPGERALFDSLTSGSDANFNRSFDFDSPFITVSKIATLAIGPGINVGPYGRLVGANLVGTQRYLSGTGIVNTGDGAVVLGNAVHGGRSGSRFDHAIYLSGCADTRGGEVAYNYAFDMDIDRGPVVVVNHQENRCSPDQQLKSHRIHHNVVDCTDFPSRAIGIFDQSWDEGEAAEPLATFVYNNVTLRCGMPTGQNALSHNNGRAIFAHNTLLETFGTGFAATGGGRIETVFVNNIVSMQSEDGRYITGEPELASHNLFFGGDPASTMGTDVVNGDPMITFDAAWLSFEIDAASPAVNAGRTERAEFVTDDFRGVQRSDGDPDLGALEFSP